jgi:hypothetical protein
VHGYCFISEWGVEKLLQQSAEMLKALRTEDLCPPYVFFAYMRLATRTRYPVGTHLLNLLEEMDDDDGRERITRPRNAWTVTALVGEDRYIVCEATGAAIVPTVAELDTQFLLTSIVHHGYGIVPRDAGGYSIVRQGQVWAYFVADVTGAKALIDSIVSEDRVGADRGPRRGVARGVIAQQVERSTGASQPLRGAPQGTRSQLVPRKRALKAR